MLRRFVILAHDIPDDKKSALESYCVDSGLYWCHWPPDTWLVALPSTASKAITRSEIGLKLKDILGKRIFIVLEFIGEANWVSLSKTELQNWLHVHWSESEPKSGEGLGSSGNTVIGGVAEVDVSEKEPGKGA